jgi:hypothetical protein
LLVFPPGLNNLVLGTLTIDALLRPLLRLSQRIQYPAIDTADALVLRCKNLPIRLRPGGIGRTCGDFEGSADESTPAFRQNRCYRIAPAYRLCGASAFWAAGVLGLRGGVGEGAAVRAGGAALWAGGEAGTGAVGAPETTGHPSGPICLPIMAMLCCVVPDPTPGHNLPCVGPAAFATGEQSATAARAHASKTLFIELPAQKQMSTDTGHLQCTMKWPSSSR